MHLRQTAMYILFASLLFTNTYAQLNDPSEIIQTTEDVQVIEESAEDKTKPKFDEEYQRKKISDEENIEQEIEQSKDAIQKAQDDGAPTNEEVVTPEDELVERKEVPLKEKSTQDLEKTLQENADQQNTEEPVQSREAVEGFAVDPTEEAAPITEKPEDISPVEEQPVENTVEAVVEEEVPVAPQYEKPVREEYVTVPSLYTPLTDAEIERLEKRTNVEIEKEPFIQTTRVLDTYLKSFKERRPTWTSQFGLEYTTYEPVNYITDINGTEILTFSDYYEYADVPLVQASLDLKRNFGFGSLGLGISGGYYTTSNDESDLSLIFISVRSHLYLDNFFNEPYVVPYGTIGYSYIDYTEDYEFEGESNEFKGSADNIYVGGGLMFQLDWIDPKSDVNSFEMGLENTFVFIEGRIYLDSGFFRTSDDPDFSSDPFIASGLKLEF